jgi:hypothetical protein
MREKWVGPARSEATQRKEGGGGPRGRKRWSTTFKLGLKPVQNYSNSSNEIRIPPNFC